MPFIKVKVNCPISDEQERELKSRMGKAIQLIPGKSEEYLLLEFEDKCRLWLRGENSEPMAYIEAAIFGNESPAGYPDFSAEVTRTFQDVLDIGGRPRLHPQTWNSVLTCISDSIWQCLADASEL